MTYITGITTRPDKKWHSATATIIPSNALLLVINNYL